MEKKIYFILAAFLIIISGIWKGIYLEFRIEYYGLFHLIDFIIFCIGTIFATLFLFELLENDRNCNIKMLLTYVSAGAIYFSIFFLSSAVIHYFIL